ncbi:Uncharacterized protein Rs2_18622 [Raphanus sativus]|nr:Uncharacterized protein Rs2_18622 [Raphanus sativus]
MESVKRKSEGQSSSHWQKRMNEETLELVKTKVWKPRSYLRCLQSCDELTCVRKLVYFQGSLRRCMNHELKQACKLAEWSSTGVQCNKALVISLLYITSSQPELCADLGLCELTIRITTRLSPWSKAVLRDGCWSKLQELYIGVSHDAYISILHECFALGKRCVQVLWMRQLINGYGNITKSERFACNDAKLDQFVCKRKTYVRTRHIKVKHHFAFNLSD